MMATFFKYRNHITPKIKFRVEHFKFTLYVFVPIAMTLLANDQRVMDKLLNYYKLVEYPATPVLTPEEFSRVVHEKREENKKMLADYEASKLQPAGGGAGGDPPAAAKKGWRKYIIFGPRSEP